MFLVDFGLIVIRFAQIIIITVYVICAGLQSRPHGRVYWNLIKEKSVMIYVCLARMGECIEIGIRRYHSNRKEVSPAWASVLKSYFNKCKNKKPCLARMGECIEIVLSRIMFDNSIVSPAWASVLKWFNEVHSTLFCLARMGECIEISTFFSKIQWLVSRPHGRVYWNLLPQINVLSLNVSPAWASVLK